MRGTILYNDKGPLTVEGVKCDNPECNHTMLSLTTDEYADLVNTACPECGDIILTKSDYNLYKFLITTTGIANKIIPIDKDSE